jgi:hypothetical protein
MKIPADAIIPSEKLTRYLLIPKPQDDKSKFLAKGGFTLDNPDDLLTAIRQLIQKENAQQDGVNEYGIFYRVEGYLKGINNYNLAVITIWIQWYKDKSFHFVTLKPKKN